MCGVIGLIYEKPRSDLGLIAAELLRSLEYRGYDSTGGALQGEGEQVWLAKGVGAPSVMVHELGIVEMGGQLFCGQVRWATFGAVDEANSQPHDVHCKTHIYGAHNGNVTNCDALKAWLTAEGHDVKSDNDGEMVVHTVEHQFEQALSALPPGQRADGQARRASMRHAIAAAAARFEGSFAAVIMDPVSRTGWAIKLGSSLYFGLGRDATSGAFGLASSDLSSILRFTRVLLPLAEGEFVEFDALHATVYGVSGREAVERPREPVRSRLRAEDIALTPPYESFMEQEIAAQEANLRLVVNLFNGGTEHARALEPAFAARPAEELAEIAAALDALRDQFADDEIRAHFYRLVAARPFRALVDAVPARVAAGLTERGLASTEAAFLADLFKTARDPDDVLAVHLLDAAVEREEARDFRTGAERFVEACEATLREGGRIFVTCCGSSFHAAKAAAVFFNELPHVDILPILPGEFRAQCARSLRDGDLLVAVSQSGETKDLIDVMNDVIASGRRIQRVSLVNNVNSTLAQEKSHVVIPLRCGPEIAVPATKSFLNQVAVFYGLALMLAERRAVEPAQRAELAGRRERLAALPSLLQATLTSTEEGVETAARMLYLRPSLHILATRIAAVAREGALKIREVVLNHAEGFEASEFKHGPNTILGLNTIYGPEQVQALLKALGQAIEALVGGATERGLGAESARRLAQAATDSLFAPRPETFALTPDEQSLFDTIYDRQALLASLYADYPLIYVTGPNERDVALTVSQINTHKIRGSCAVMIAEESAALRAAILKPPADNPDYRAVYITLPRTNDTLMVVFSATVVLQRLALRMSLLKMQALDRLGLRDHGVHPDVPKNVSKSITVD